MTEQFPFRKRNALLADIPVEEWKQLIPHVQEIALTSEDILHHAHEHVEHVYFPLSGSVSLLTQFTDGFSVETAEIGNEGMIGIPLVSSQASNLVTAKVLVPGVALRIAIGVLIARLDRLSTLDHSLLRAVGTQVARSMQLTACNAHHHLDARLARRLLELHDRTAGQLIAVTHEGFAALLCAHRPSVSVTMKRFERQGLIRQRTGSLLVTDREGLEEASCECYAIMQALRGAVGSGPRQTREV